MSAPAGPISYVQKEGAAEADLQVLNLVAFSGASNWPLWIGQQAGFFRDQGIELRLKLTPNSALMARDLQSGEAQIALTSIDNVIAYTNGHGEVPLDGPADFFAFMGVDAGLLSIMAQPGINAVGGLRGQRLAVDALTTGYAFVLKELLSLWSVTDADVEYLAVGTGAERLAALKAGTCSATLLNAPLCLAAEYAGKRRIVRASEVLGSYQGIVGAAGRNWAASNRNVVEKFIRAFHRSLYWLRDPENYAAACTLLADRMPILNAVVPLAYRTLVTDRGLEENLGINWEGTVRVIKLREKYGRPNGGLGDPSRYIDDSFRLAALA